MAQMKERRRWRWVLLPENTKNASYSWAILPILHILYTLKLFWAICLFHFPLPSDASAAVAIIWELFLPAVSYSCILLPPIWTSSVAFSLHSARLHFQHLHQITFSTITADIGLAVCHARFFADSHVRQYKVAQFTCKCCTYKTAISHYWQLKTFPA